MKRLFLIQFLIYTTTALYCHWDFSITPEDAAKENCGFVCPDAPKNENPHYCGNPHPCCCAPSCSKTESQQNSFIGVNWSDTFSAEPLTRDEQFTILKKEGIKHIKTFTPEALNDIYKVYGEDVSVYLGIPNEEIPKLAKDQEYARYYVQKNLLPHHTIVKMIIVGNEVFDCIKTKNWRENNECGPEKTPLYLNQAMINIDRALTRDGMSKRVSTAFSAGILQPPKNPWTPCAAELNDNLRNLLWPIFYHLLSGNSPLIVNFYPFFPAKDKYINLESALGLPQGDTTPMDGKYRYMFNLDWQVDSMKIAMCKNNIYELDLWIGETGWPSGGSDVTNSGLAFKYIISATKRSRGQLLDYRHRDTSRFARIGIPLFIFEAFDEERKHENHNGDIFEDFFGLHHEIGHNKWNMNQILFSHN